MTSQSFSVVRQAVGYVRTLDHLRAWQLLLPREVTEVVVAVSTSGGKQHEGTKLFLQQNVPQLKFHNPSVQFSVESSHENKSEIILVSEDSGHQSVETTGLRGQDIQKQLNTLYQPRNSDCTMWS